MRGDRAVSRKAPGSWRVAAVTVAAALLGISGSGARTPPVTTLSHSISVKLNAGFGTVNPYRSIGGAGPFPGDIVTFLSSTSPVTLNWNFGNPESPNNTATASSGTAVTHQYSRLTTAGAVSSSRTIVAVNAANAADQASVQLALSVPTVRAVITPGGQPFTSGPITALLGSSIADASDGSVESHLTTWTIDGVPTARRPDQPMSVGACGAHTVSVQTQYGGYVGTSPNLPAYQATLSNLSLTVRPLISSLTLGSSNATNVTFQGISSSTVSTVTHQWDLLNNSSAVIQTQSGVVATGSVDNFVVARASLPPSGWVVRLTSSVPVGSVPGGCAAYTTYQTTFSGASCTPAITSQPSGKTINAGQSATLTVGASGGGLAYQWYAGEVGVTTSPVAGGNGSSVTVTPAVTTKYWVRVYGTCGSVDSTAATVAVLPPTCTVPSIFFQPESRTVNQGVFARLEVGATGTALQYQWYVGERGVTTTPVSGGTAAVINVSPSVTTKYWVRVSGQCGSPVNSLAATVTVQLPQPPPVILSFKASPSSIPGGQNAASILSWTVQNATAITINNGGGSFGGGNGTKVVSPTVTTTYELTASGSGPSAKATAVVTVTSEPPGIFISFRRADASKVVRPGQPVTLLWSTKGATFATLNGESIDPLGGGREVFPSAPQTTYTLRATNGSRSATAILVVPVSSALAPTANLSVTPENLSGPGPVTVAWTSTNATRAWLDGEEVQLNDQKTVQAAALQNFAFKVEGPGGEDAITKGVLVGGQKNPPVNTPGGKSGEPGSNDGPGSSARFREPAALGADGKGNLFVVDAGNHTIRRIDAVTGEVTTWAGVAGQRGQEDDTASTKGHFDFDGFPGGFFVDLDGEIQVAERGDRVRKVSKSGKISTCATCGILETGGVVKDGAGNQYEASTGAHAIIKTTPSSQRVIIGSTQGEPGFRDGEAGTARFRTPSGIDDDRDGNVYVVDAGNNAIRRIAPDGTVSTVAGNVPLANAGRSTRTITTGAFSFGCCGVALQVGPDGLLYLPDPGTNTIKSVNVKTGKVSTVAGSGESSGLDGSAEAAGFRAPRGLAIDSAGRIVVADTGNHTIRTIETRLAEQLTMLSDRFEVQVTYRNQFDGNKEGALVGQSLSSSTTAETATFTFGDPLVIELLVRLSDARPFRNNIDVFFGGVSDVEFTITVKDTLTGRQQTYLKPPNQPLGGVDRQTFVASPSSSLLGTMDALRRSGVNALLPSTVRLLNRYDVRVRYRNQFANPVTTGELVGQSIASSATTETAVFTFNDPEVVEWMVRFSDARPFANRIDFFHGGVSDIEFTIDVNDTVTGTARSYTKPAGSFLGAVDRNTWKP